MIKEMKKLMWTFGRTLLVAVLSFLPVSCDKGDMISVDTTELSFTQKGESKEFNISYIGEWHIEALDMEYYLGPNKADVRDFSFEPAWGKGDTTVSVTLNNEIAENYTVDLKVVGENGTVVVKLNAVANINETQY